MKKHEVIKVLVNPTNLLESELRQIKGGNSDNEAICDRVGAQNCGTRGKKPPTKPELSLW
jgi:hypothetical protein